jgi:prepilin-type N-terminal cleavage/methylation domain-containing protein
MQRVLPKAFSLIELSIVILIIGILVAGVTQSSRLVAQFKLKTAQNITQASPVNSIKDLLLWYETSTAASIVESEAENGQQVSTWYDINPQVSFKNNAIQTTPNKRPIYTDNIFNGVPGLKFDGTNDSLVLSPELTLATTQTSFVVFKPTTAAENGMLLSTTSNVGGRYQVIRYQGDSSFLSSWNGVVNNSTITPSANAQIAVFTQNGASTQFFHNGTALGVVTQNNESFKFSQIGELDVNDQGPFDGYIAEIIIFERSLKSEERRVVEEYLSKKYAIVIS